LKKPPRVSSLREPSGKKTGGQKGPPGETLCQVAKPDSTIDHYPDACAGCGKSLTAATATADSGDRERPIRSIVNTGSGDHERPVSLA
jgi:transposase